jgi:DNA-binding FadR family transcriptional regulator
MLVSAAHVSKSAVDQASLALRDLLVRGRYQPGDRLPTERDLAEGLGLSRPTLREAILRLTESGLLVARRGSGTFVREVDVEAVFAVRLRLEPFAAALAAEHRTDEQAEQLVALLAELESRLDDAAEFAATDARIHREIAQAASNPVLFEILVRIADLAQLTRSVTSPEHAARTTTLETMAATVEAIRRREATVAAQAMEDHLGALRDVARVEADRSVSLLP